MAVHNGERFLAAAIESIRKQTLRDLEIIIVDDGSDDVTPRILAALAQRDPRIRVITNSERRGLAASLNRGLDECRAPLVARTDADDLNEPDRLERQVRFLEENPHVGVVSCGYRAINEAGVDLRTVTPTTGDGPLRIRMLFSNSILHSGVVYRASLVRSVGGYDQRYWTAQDADLWSRLLPLTRFANLPDPLVRYRQHGESMMKSRGPEGEVLSATVGYRMLSRYLGKRAERDDIRALTAFHRGFRMDRREIKRAMRGLRRLLEEVQRREQPRTVAAHRRQVGEAIWRQAWIQLPGDPILGMKLILAGIRWLGLGRSFKTMSKVLTILRSGVPRFHRQHLSSAVLPEHAPLDYERSPGPWAVRGTPRAAQPLDNLKTG